MSDWMRWRGGVIALLFALSGLLLAQEPVSDNAVNRIAQKMYCPVCENIPLDECQTITCVEWKEEIRQQLVQGSTEAEIIADFVRRFGDRVVGIPQDPTLRALTFALPLLGLLLALGAAGLTLARMGRLQKLALADEPAGGDEAAYRQRLENDLLARR